jgi:hypothetical protein
MNGYPDHDMWADGGPAQPPSRPPVAPPYVAPLAGSYEHPPVWGGPALPASSGPGRTGGSANVLQPGVMPLRPLGLGDLYDAAIKAIQTNPRTMVGIPALVSSVLAVLLFVPDLIQLRYFIFSLPQSGSQDSATGLLLLSASPLLAGLLTVLAMDVVIGMLVVAVNGAAFGRAMEPGQVWSTIRRRIPGILGVGLISSLVPAALLLIPLGIGAALFFVTHPAIAALVGTLLTVLGLTATLVLFTWWSMAYPVLILEGRGVRASLGRSRDLVRGHGLRVFGILALTWIIVEVVGEVLSLPFSLLGLILLTVVTAPGTGLYLLAQSSITMGDVITSMILYPFVAAVVTLLYLDLRIRHEGLDVELISAQQEAG